MNSQHTAEPMLLRLVDVAQRLSVTPSMVYTLVRRGDLPAIRLSPRGMRISSDVLEAWLAQRAVLVSSSTDIEDATT